MVIVSTSSGTNARPCSSRFAKAFRNADDRKPYYPGAEERQKTFVEHHPDADAVWRQGRRAGALDADPPPRPEPADDICFNTESWCGQTSEVALPASSIVEYIDKAVDFCNDRSGAHSPASIIVHPKSLKDPAVAEAVERAIANLRYGSVAVNHWSGLIYALVTPTWGAFPGHTVEDIRSGQGVVHNTFMFDRPQKSVHARPVPRVPEAAWFVDNEGGRGRRPKADLFQRRPVSGRLPGLLWASMFG